MPRANINDLVNHAKQILPLRNELLGFLAKWYIIVNDDLQQFGFREVRGMNEQLEMAIDFLIKTEREWQDRVRENKTSLQFPLYFEFKARSEGIKLPENFNEKIGGVYEF